MNQRQSVSSRHILAAFMVAFASVVAIGGRDASAAACVAPGTDYGTVTYNASVSATATYRIWVRMAAPSASINTVMLEVDGNTCYTVGGSTVPVYANGTSTHFANNTSNWINRTSGGATISQSLTSGSHAIELIGTGAGVVVDRIIITADDSCTPIGTGDNCAMVYVAPDIDMNGNVNFLDFSRLASRYNQTSGSLGRVDINGDGTISFLDYSLLASKYGQ
jgi:hypothetical protein